VNKILTIIFATLIVTLGMWLAPGVVRANAASCSAASVGGEKVPAIDNTNGTVGETGEQGYKCTVQWIAELQPMYESGGTWHYCTVDNNPLDECVPGWHQNVPGSFWPANQVFEWPLQNGHLTDPLWVWTISTGTALDAPVCAFNWHIQVNFSSTNNNVFQSDVSPELHKTC
jgi:hypothetical protein